MLLLLNILVYACGLASTVCGIIILISAFQDDVGKGFLCLCVPFYVLFYAFSEFDHEKKELILTLWLLPLLLCLGATCLTSAMFSG